MMDRSRFLMAICVALCVAGPAKAQDKQIDVLTPSPDETRFDPATLCEMAAGATALSDKRSLRLSLTIPNKQTYKIGETAAFRLTVKNMGSDAIAIPSEVCSAKSSLANQPGVLEACINLKHTTPSGEGDWFTGPCLCGREDNKGLTELEPEQSIVVRGAVKILLTDTELFSAVYAGQKPTLFLEPDINFSRQHFPPRGGKNALDGCIEDVPTKVEVENKASIQIMAAARDRSHWDAPPEQK
jgi:hypothetical protein